MPCSSISARRRSRLPNASAWSRNSATNALRSSSVEALQRVEPVEQHARAPRRARVVALVGFGRRRADADAVVSPSIFCELFVENVTCVDCVNFDGSPANSWIRVPSGVGHVADRQVAACRVDVALEAVGRLVEVVVGVVDAVVEDTGHGAVISVGPRRSGRMRLTLPSRQGRRVVESC